MGYISDTDVIAMLTGKKIKRVSYDAKDETLTIEVAGGAAVVIEAHDFGDDSIGAELRFQDRPLPPRPLRKGDTMTQLLSIQGKTRAAVYRVDRIEPGGPVLVFIGWQD